MASAFVKILWNAARVFPLTALPIDTTSVEVVC